MDTRRKDEEAERVTGSWGKPGRRGHALRPPDVGGQVSSPARRESVAYRPAGEPADRDPAQNTCARSSPRPPVRLLLPRCGVLHVNKACLSLH